MKKLLLLAFIIATSINTKAQGNFSGDLMMNVNFFDRDSTINASNNPLYDNYLSGGEAWLSLRYSNKNFSAFVRADAFHNSNLLNLTSETTGYGIGAWGAQMDVGNLNITGGYIYDQIGSGILFRTYEDRGLLIDNALVGLRLKYKLNDHIYLKGFTGQQKFLFTRYQPIIKAINADAEYSIGERGTIAPGIGIMNRTLDRDNMNAVVAAINAQNDTTKFVPKYNMYAATLYNTLSVGDITWFIEGAIKSKEAIAKDEILKNVGGTVLYSTLSYARKGFAINLTGKRTENFEMRTSPNEILLRGMLNWQPIVARIRPQRLLARYMPASQNLSEMAFGVDGLISPTEKLDITLNYTHINTLDEVKLYREVYAHALFRGWDKTTVSIGAQYLEYNQERYQVKPGAPMVKAITPFAEIIYRINKKNSIRAEVEYMSTKQDFGSWIFALVEFTVAPKWSIAVSDMYLTYLNPKNPVGLKDPKHFYNFFVAYTKGANRFTAQYVKQVEGINCTGGVCRYEPAFSGFKIGVTSSF